MQDQLLLAVEHQGHIEIEPFADRRIGEYARHRRYRAKPGAFEDERQFPIVRAHADAERVEHRLGVGIGCPAPVVPKRQRGVVVDRHYPFAPPVSRHCSSVNGTSRSL
jgi:hypothetical protein